MVSTNSPRASNWSRAIANIITALDGRLIQDTPALRGNFVYLVQWADGVTKIGFASARGRWRKFVSRGANLIALGQFQDSSAALEAESQIQNMLAALYPASFQARGESLSYLGDGGGYTECYTAGVAND